MRKRRDAVEKFLAYAGWSNATREQLAGDMSARRYTRLRRGDGARAVLMDAPPETDASTPAFVAMTVWLRLLEISAPRIMAADPPAGLLLLEDLGSEKFTDLIARDPSRQEQLYRDTLPLLTKLKGAEGPNLPRPTARELLDWTKLADDRYPGARKEPLDRFRGGLETVLGKVLRAEATVSLRDFHADNLLWLPERSEIERIGVLDYQDAFLTHPIYDLVSLLTDARTHVPTSLREKILDAYIDLDGSDPQSMRLAFAAFSAQRNLRIVGIFASSDAKARLIPRVVEYLRDALRHPALSHLEQHLDAGLPSIRDFVQ